MKRKDRLSLFALVCVAVSLLAGSLNCWAQQSSATIVGSITDPSGAAVPNATVTVMGLSTGFKQVLVTNGVGAYTAAALDPGTYNLTVEASGFQRVLQTGVTLTVGQTQRVDLQLKVGQATQEVTIQGNVTQVQTESGAVSSAIIGSQIQNLELNGRNVYSLLTLVAGAAPSGSWGSGGLILGHTSAEPSVAFNGIRTTYGNFELDGGNNSDEGSGANGGDVTPSVDMIQEFRISTSNYGADVGQHAGAIVEFITKSGTNRFHGDLHEFLRNDALDANDWFLNRQINPEGGNAPKTPLKWNTFGGTIGGPFYIPGKYERGKTYFFYSQQIARYRQGSVLSNFTPSLRMRQGDFSECDPNSANANPTIISQGCVVPTDPNTGNPFSGNHVPVDPNAATLLNAFVPLPNNGVDGFVASKSVPHDYRQESIRVDQNFTDKVRAFVRYTRDYDDQVISPSLWSGGSFGSTATSQVTPATSAIIHLTYLAKPTLMTEFLMSYADDPHDYLPLAGPASPAGSVTKPSSWTVKSIIAANQSNPLLPGVHVSGGLPGSFDESSLIYPYINNNPVWTFKNNNIWTQGTRTYKFGFFAEWFQKNETFGVGGAVPQGELHFNTGSSVTTGNGLADMFLGRIAQYNEASAVLNGVPVGGYNKGHWRAIMVEPYFQTDWKVTHRLTLNAGVRYYYFTPRRDFSHPTTVDSTFDPSQYNPAFAAQLDASGNLVVNPATGNISTYQSYGNGLLQCGAGSVPPGCTRMTYGTVAPRLGFAWDPWGNGKTVIRGGYGMYFDYDPQTGGEGLEANPPSTFSPAAYNVVGYNSLVPGPIGPSSLGTSQTRLPNPQIQQFNFMIERQLFQQDLLSVGFVGNLGRHLYRQRDLNFVPYGSKTKNVPALAGTTGCDAEGNCDVQNILINNVQPTIFFVPYRGYTTITSQETSAVSNYNSLQVSYRHPFRHGLTAQIAYTYSHTLDDSSGTDGQAPNVDPGNLSRWYGTSSLNRAHIFVMNYVYNLPFFGNSPNRFLKQTLGGWKVSGITTFSTGNPIDFNCGVSGFSSGIGLGYRCNLAGHLGILKGSTNDPQFGPTPTWFNPAVITQPLLSQLSANGEQGMFGYMGRNVLTGPGQNNTDFGLLKEFQLPWFGSEHSTLEFRADTFNSFNHPQWLGANAGCNSSIGFGQPCTQTGNGEVNSAWNPRLLQLGLRFTF